MLFAHPPTANYFLLHDLDFAHTIDTQSNQSNKGDPMKHLYKSTAVLLLLLPISMMSSAAGTDNRFEPQKIDEPMKEMSVHQGMGMMGGMTEEQKTEKMRAMQEHMLQMHDLSNQILIEKDPAKKEALKKQQLELMKAHHVEMMEHRQQKMQEHKK
jgi:hypothetical protein